MTVLFCFFLWNTSFHFFSSCSSRFALLGCRWQRCFLFVCFVFLRFSSRPFSFSLSLSCFVLFFYLFWTQQIATLVCRRRRSRPTALRKNTKKKEKKTQSANEGGKNPKKETAWVRQYSENDGETIEKDERGTSVDREKLACDVAVFLFWKKNVPFGFFFIGHETSFVFRLKIEK